MTTGKEDCSGAGTTILAQASSIVPDPIPATASATALNSLKYLDIQGSATLSSNVHVGGKTLIEGIFNVIDSITTNNFIATGWADFMGRYVCRYPDGGYGWYIFRYVVINASSITDC